MIAVILAKRILSLFIILGCGTAIVKTKLLKSEQSKTLSAVLLYILIPSMLIGGFQINRTPEIEQALMLVLIADIIANVVFFVVGYLVVIPFFHLDPVEKTSVLYPNVGNLALPIASGVYGAQGTALAGVFPAIQNILIWTHCKSVVEGSGKPSLKSIVTSPTLIAVVVGITVFFLNIHFPAPIQDAFSLMGARVGPVSMLVAGMILADLDIKSAIRNKRLWLVTGLRMIVMPMILIPIFSLSYFRDFCDNSTMVLNVVMFGAAGPPAQVISNMAQLYDKDYDGATAINLVSTLLCIVTMPMLVFILDTLLMR